MAGTKSTGTAEPVLKFMEGMLKLQHERNLLALGQRRAGRELEKSASDEEAALLKRHLGPLVDLAAAIDSEDPKLRGLIAEFEEVAKGFGIQVPLRKRSPALARAPLEGHARTMIQAAALGVQKDVGRPVEDVVAMLEAELAAQLVKGVAPGRDLTARLGEAREEIARRVAEGRA